MVDLISLGGLLLAFFLVVMNGVFVAAEFAFVKVRPTQVNALVERGKPGAALVQTSSRIWMTIWLSVNSASRSPRLVSAGSASRPWQHSSTPFSAKCFLWERSTSSRLSLDSASSRSSTCCSANSRRRRSPFRRPRVSRSSSPCS